MAISLLLTIVALFTAPAGAAGHKIALGAYIPHADESSGLIDSFGQEVGRRPSIVNSFKTFDQIPIYPPQLDGIAEAGAIPMITWEAQTSSEGRIDLAAIAHGSYDGYISSAAETAAEWGRPMMIRFSQEMNGFWYPWSPAAANSANSYVAAWRRIVRVFRREGADNVKWVWTPYVETEHTLSMRRFYPGDHFVDWAGLDGYNWGGSFEWKSFRTLFAASYRKLLTFTNRPLMVGEVGCGEFGGNKSRWLRLMLRRDLPRMTHIRAVLWYDQIDPKGDLRVDTSGSALRSLRRWTAAPLYSADRRAVLRTPRRLPSSPRQGSPAGR
jgi:Glycosyl hydrolase family 26